MGFVHKFLWPVLASVMGTAVVGPIAGEFFSNLLKEDGYLQHPNVMVARVIAFLHIVYAQWWFSWVSGIAIGLTAALAVESVRRRKKIAPQPAIALSFDPNSNFCVQDVDLQWEDVGRQYSIAVKNASAATIQCMRASIEWQRGVVTSAKFSGGDTIDLNPGMTDYITVYVYNETWEEQNRETSEWENPVDFTVKVSAHNTLTSFIKMRIDVEDNPHVKIVP